MILLVPQWSLEPRVEHYTIDSIAEPAFNYENLVQLIQLQQIHSIDDLVSKLPPSMKSNIILMYASQSMQDADPLHPRVILFTNDAKLTCAYGKGPTLECFQFRDQTARFDFREILFSDLPDKKIWFSASNRSADGKKSCTACHGQDPRPNWESYSFWPGSYGSQDDLLDPHPRGHVPFYFPNRILITKEAAGFRAFRKTKLPRYVDLNFSNSRRWSLSQNYKDKNFQERPSQRFGYAVSRLVARRDFRLIQDFFTNQEKYKLLSGFAGCSGSESPQTVLSRKFSGAEWTPFFRNNDSMCKECKLADDEDGSLDGKMGASPRNYEYSVGSSKGSLDHIVADDLLQYLAGHGDHEFKGYASAEKYNAEDLPIMSFDLVFPNPERLEYPASYCIDLKAKANGRGLPDALPLPEKKPDLSIGFASTCLKCHGGSNHDAPVFPMDDPLSLKPLLPLFRQRMSDKNKPMPPDGPLDSSEQQLLFQYFNSIEKR
jgi:hypothetical protein